MTLATGSSGSPTLDIVGYVVQYGLPGLIFLDIAIFHRVFTLQFYLANEQKERERERVEKDALIAEQKATISRLTDLAEQQVIPALTRATEVNKDYLTLLQERRRDNG